MGLIIKSHPSLTNQQLSIFELHFERAAQQRLGTGDVVEELRTRTGGSAELHAGRQRDGTLRRKMKKVEEEESCQCGFGSQNIVIFTIHPVKCPELQAGEYTRLKKKTQKVHINIYCYYYQINV
ncbi:hypothetical protein HN51_008391 [Arachis hypogaea]